FPQFAQLAGLHIFDSCLSFDLVIYVWLKSLVALRLLLFAKEASEESRLFGVVGVTLALLRFRNSAHNHVNVLAAARPGGFAALAAGYF
ncbi:MAG: hypothetical protein RL174_287, partial [Actinomycetota bacterium]